MSSPASWTPRSVVCGSAGRSRRSTPARFGGTTFFVFALPSAAAARQSPGRSSRSSYFVFSAPMGLGAGGAYTRLADEHGNPLADPFLPLDVELWNEDRTRFTVLYDPGRVKRGILPNEEMDRPLAAGRAYTLEIDPGWRDAEGQPLVAPFRREFRLGPPRARAGPCRLAPGDPGPGHPGPPRSRLPRAAGLRPAATRAAGGDRQRPAAGWGRSAWNERRRAGSSTPRTPWHPGQHQLVAAATLEDVAGNRIGRPFEVDGSAGPSAQRASGARAPFRTPR